MSLRASATTAAARRGSSSPTSQWRWTATTPVPRSRTSSPRFSQRVLQLADLDRALHHPRIERGIVVLQALDRTRTIDPPLDPGDQHFEMEGLQDHVVGARFISSNRAFWIRFPGDQHDGDIVPLDFAADRAGKLRAAHARHVELGEYQLDR